MNIIVGARKSNLSKAQVQEVLKELNKYHPEVCFSARLALSKGDKNLSVSLRGLEKTDFFTREIDEMLLLGECRIAVHSAKDLPEPLCPALEIVALTKGVDSSDSLVLKTGETVESLPQNACIATSSERRELAVKKLRDDFCFLDIRGTIEQRLEKLFLSEIDGVVIAEAALIRLNLTHLNRVRLPEETCENQGRLAVVARKGDEEIKQIFKCLDSR